MLIVASYLNIDTRAASHLTELSSINKTVDSVLGGGMMDERPAFISVLYCLNICAGVGLDAAHYKVRVSLCSSHTHEPLNPHATQADGSR